MRFSRPAGRIGAATEAETDEKQGARNDPILGIGLIALALVLLLGIGWQIFGARDTFVVDVNRPAASTPDASEVKRDWQGELQSEIAARGLTENLQVGQIKDGILQMRGQVPESVLPKYRDLQAWFDGQTGAPPIVWDVSQRTRLTGLPVIGMVRISAPAAVILATGTTVNIGDTLTEGWVLEAVDQETLTLKRGLETQRVNYKAVTP